MAAALALGLGALLLLRSLARPLALLIVAITIAEALSPLVSYLHRWIPRALAIALVYVTLLVLGGGLAWLVVPVLVAQGQELVSRAPDLIDRARALLDTWDTMSGGQVAGILSSWAERVSGTLIVLPFALLSSALDILLIIFLSIYWLAGSPSIMRFALSLFPESRREKAARVLQHVGTAMGGYVRGAAINAVIMGTLAWIGLSLIGVHYAIVLGVLTMLGEPVPYIGPIVVAVPVILTALLQSPTKALFALILYTALEQLEGHILTPNIMRRQTRVPQTLVIFALVAGATLGGLIGVLVSIPIAGALHVLVTEVVAPAERRSVGSGDITPAHEADDAAETAAD